MWTVTNPHPLLKYEELKFDADFSNSFYHYFVYNEKDATFGKTYPDIAQVEQTYFGSSVVALANSLGGISRLVKNVFYDKETFQKYVEDAKSQDVTLPAHVNAKAKGGSIFRPDFLIREAVDTVTDTVRDIVDDTTSNLLGFKLSKVMPFFLAGLLIFGAFWVYRQVSFA